MAGRQSYIKALSMHINVRFRLPSKYKYLKVVGEGGYGTVLKCLDKDSKDIVAVKIPKRANATTTELDMMQTFMHHQFDQRNIVKFLDSFEMRCGTALVFERLDISLYDHMMRHGQLCLGDIRDITRQVATALGALRSIKVIHTDIKPDNIMLVDRKVRPLRVKLIDFGVAVHKRDTFQGMRLQTLYFRAPEIILGTRFSEAIDMWSVGCVLGTMMLRDILFPGQDEYGVVKAIVEMLGQPEDRLLKAGRKTKLYFKRTEHRGWRLKEPLEFYKGKDKCYIDYRGYKYHSLDDIKYLRRWKKHKTDMEELELCVQLLKAMLTMDAAERITPRQVLAHPFIAGDHHNDGDDASDQTTSEPTEDSSVYGRLRIFSRATVSFPCSKTSISCSDTDRESYIRMLTHTRPLLGGEMSDSLSSDSDLPSPRFFGVPAADVRICTDNGAPAPAKTRTLVIEVQPADGGHNTESHDQEGATSETISTSQLPTPVTSQPDTDSEESYSRLLANVNKANRTEGWACPGVSHLKRDGTTHVHMRYHIPSPAIPRPLVIKVRPAAPDNRMVYERKQSDTSLQFRLNKMLEPSIGSTATEEEEQQRRTKKRKKSFWRFCSWMKRNLCCWVVRRIECA